MADIVVTTPKSQMAAAAAEAGAVKKAGGGFYFRRFGLRPPTGVGDRMYYAEDGFMRGFGVVAAVAQRIAAYQCETTGRWWAPGWYVWIDAATAPTAIWRGTRCGSSAAGWIRSRSKGNERRPWWRGLTTS